MSTRTTGDHPHRRSISFQIGLAVATKGALAAMLRSRERPAAFINRHQRGDWGEVCAEDQKLNDEAVAHEGDPDRQDRVLSAYRTALGERLWVITEADRSVTTLLVPEEY